MAQKASSGATGSPSGLSSSPARAMAGSASPATSSNRPLAPRAATSGPQVWQATARGDRGSVAQRVGHLGDEPRLADAGGAQDREQLARPVLDGLLERVGELPALAYAADHRHALALRAPEGVWRNREQSERRKR